MRIALVAGCCPTDRCGVGDYTRSLADVLSAMGIETHVICSENWRLQNAFSLHSSLHKLNPDLVHIQYPTAGFGPKLGPQGLALLRRCVITLHEVSQARFLRKLAMFPFSLRPKHLIFPSDFERRFAVRWAPWISPLSSVIAIPSNIRAAVPQGARNVNEVTYFGLIMPNKGLDDVVKLGALIQCKRLPLRVRVIGKAPTKHMAYFEELRSASSTLPIIWDDGLSEGEVAEKLASSSVAYLPYPDGVSERRATFKAALVNGLAVITTRGLQTPLDLEGLVRFCRNPEEALVAALSLFQNPQERARLAQKGAYYVRQFSWERIGELHSLVYEEILRGKCSPGVNPAKNAIAGK
jgi:glycosyltransferase involved in cell wall biosynthesis